MIRATLLSVLLVMGATAAMSQSLRVRSGEHGDYTRLVVQVPQGTSWILTPTQGGADLEVALDKAIFDTSFVFDRLSAQRLRWVSQSRPGAALNIEFGCDCEAAAFLHKQTMVVIDIAPAKPGVPEIAQTSVVTDDSDVASPGLPWQDDGILPLLQVNRQQLETQLMSRVLQGADREILNLTLSDAGPRSTKGVGPLADTQIEPQHIRLSSVLDHVRNLPPSGISHVATGLECLADQAFAFDTWSGDQPFDAQLATLRSGLYEEFDRLSLTHGMQLARFYAYYGFGAEALQVLDLLGDAPPEAGIVAAIANRMDGRDASAQNPLAGMHNCEGDVALWAVLTQDLLPRDANLDAIEQGFFRLPDHLKQQFAPALSAILVRSKQLESSRRVLRSLDNLGSPEGTGTVLAKAEVANAEGDGDAEEELLTDLAAAPNGRADAALALARLLDKRWSDRGSATQQEVALAAGYALELRGTGLGTTLARAHALSLALNQQYEVSFQAINAAPAVADWRRTRDQVLHLLAERADDITFLRHVLALPQSNRSQIGPGTSLALSFRLTNLGFADQALAFAGNVKGATRVAERAVLRARARLSKGRPHQALLEVSGIDSEQAMDLRAQALALTGAFNAAAGLSRQAGNAEAADRFLWLSEKSADIPASESSTFSKVARISQRLDQPMTRIADKPLADASGLLEDSRETRQNILQMFTLLGLTGEE